MFAVVDIITQLATHLIALEQGLQMDSYAQVMVLVLRPIIVCAIQTGLVISVTYPFALVFWVTLLLSVIMAMVHV